MESAYTFDYKRPDRKDDFCVTASSGEWHQVLEDLRAARVWLELSSESERLISELTGWGVK